MVSTSIRLTPAGSGRDTFAATTVTSAPRFAAAAASAIPIRPLERLPMKRTESIGSRVPPAVTRTRRPFQGPGSAAGERRFGQRRRTAAAGERRPRSAPSRPVAAGQCRLDPRQQLLRVGQPAAAALAARGEEALARLDHLDPALAQGRQVGLGGGVGVHAVVHRRGDEPRRRAGEEGGRQHRVGEAARQLGERVGRGGRDEEGVAVGGQLEVADRVVALLPGFAGEGAAHRVALELGGEHRRADDPLEGGGADEALGVLGHHDPDTVAGERCQARELKRLVGRYPSADTQQQPGHL